VKNDEVLNSDLVRSRIIQIEYKELTESEIRRIYIEETGTEPPANITIYSSDDFPELRERDTYSGFDGSAIIFTLKKRGSIKCIRLPAAVKEARKTVGSRNIGLVLRWDRLSPHNKFSEKLSIKTC
jgi:hypothetical protein